MENQLFRFLIQIKMPMEIKLRSLRKDQFDDLITRTVEETVCALCIAVDNSLSAVPESDILDCDVSGLIPKNQFDSTFSLHNIKEQYDNNFHQSLQVNVQPYSSASQSFSKPDNEQLYASILMRICEDARYFLIKSNNHENVALAKAKEVWSTPPVNESKLNRAFRTSKNVILIFSVVESGRFQGFARMASESRHDIGRVNWVLPRTLNVRSFTGLIQLQWISRRELPFSQTLSLQNAWNENRPVKIGRDGQEIDPKCGEALCRLFPIDFGCTWDKVPSHVSDNYRNSRSIRRNMSPCYKRPRKLTFLHDTRMLDQEVATSSAREVAYSRDTAEMLAMRERQRSQTRNNEGGAPAIKYAVLTPSMSVEEIERILGVPVSFFKGTYEEYLEKMATYKRVKRPTAQHQQFPLPQNRHIESSYEPIKPRIKSSVNSREEAYERDVEQFLAKTRQHLQRSSNRPSSLKRAYDY
ncbi:hypothetical protein GJ496_000976 [Pomphorhynchus laevis]|nr:hypothetical protein GJ496_000976 [Pomphorhynchus laevis]